MAHLLIAAVGSAGVAVIAVFATTPTYHVAPVFLIPVLWIVYALRRPLNLHPFHYALLASALLLHMLGAFGWYQRSPLPFSFDILVHCYFALAVTLPLHRALLGRLLPHLWWAAVATFFFVMGLAALHEVMEYGTYYILGEERGMLKPTTSYVFDTQRDLTSNLAGTLAALAAIAARRRIESISCHVRDNHTIQDQG